MANFDVEFFSDSLRGIAHFHASVPNDVPAFMTEGNPHFKRPTKLLLLLHGYNGTYTDWLYGTNINTLSGLYNLAVIMPDGRNNFYLNDDAGFYRFEDYVGKELVDYARKLFSLSDKREDTMIGGFSMGGFGSLHTALAHPETFGSVLAFSSALIVDNIKDLKPGEQNEVASFEVYERIFGDLKELKASEKNPEVLVKKIKTEGGEFPKIYMACGTEDFLLENNREFKKFLEGEEVPFKYVESPGIHDWAFWQSQLEPALKYLLDADTDAKGKDYFVKGS